MSTNGTNDTQHAKWTGRELLAGSDNTLCRLRRTSSPFSSSLLPDSHFSFIDVIVLLTNQTSSQILYTIQVYLLNYDEECKWGYNPVLHFNFNFNVAAASRSIGNVLILGLFVHLFTSNGVRVKENKEGSTFVERESKQGKIKRERGKGGRDWRENIYVQWYVVEWERGRKGKESRWWWWVLVNSHPLLPTQVSSSSTPSTPFLVSIPLCLCL